MTRVISGTMSNDNDSLPKKKLLVTRDVIDAEIRTGFAPVGIFLARAQADFDLFLAIPKSDIEGGYYHEFLQTHGLNIDPAKMIMIEGFSALICEDGYTNFEAILSLDEDISATARESNSAFDYIDDYQAFMDNYEADSLTFTFPRLIADESGAMARATRINMAWTKVAKSDPVLTLLDAFSSQQGHPLLRRSKTREGVEQFLYMHFTCAVLRQKQEMVLGREEICETLCVDGEDYVPRVVVYSALNQIESAAALVPATI